MAALPYMQLYIADYLADTMHLSTEEHGAYLLLMFNYWQTGRAIPKNRLAKIARMSNDRWISVEESLREFFNETETEWVHARIERDLEIVRASIEQKSAAGRASAAKRKAQNQTNSQRESNGCSTGVGNPFEQDYNENATNKDPDKDINKELKDPPKPPKGRRSVDNVDALNVELPSWLNSSLWAEWVDFRRQLRKPIKTARGAAESIKRLGEYREQGYTPESVIRHCIANEYQGLYPPQSKPQRRDINKISEPDDEIPPGFRGAK